MITANELLLVRVCVRVHVRHFLCLLVCHQDLLTAPYSTAADQRALCTLFAD